MKLEQLQFLNELLTTPGIALTREKWRIAAETESELAKAINDAKATSVPVDVKAALSIDAPRVNDPPK